VRDAGWPRTDVDRFVLAKLESANLKPVGDADRAALLRRVTFDLVGLPPTPEEVAAFVADRSPDAFEKVVDRLLASPRFGEKWGRHWLDVARYAESTGSTRNYPYHHAWRYRDYVIDSFNADKPYDTFVMEQVAGDLMPAKDAAQRNERLVATGLLAMGVKDLNERDREKFAMDNVDEQIDTVSRAVLADHDRLRPLPRPQVRPDPDRGVLQAGRHLPEHRHPGRRDQQARRAGPRLRGRERADPADGRGPRAKRRRHGCRDGRRRRGQDGRPGE
jgi:hypothetical protein